MQRLLGILIALSLTTTATAFDNPFKSGGIFPGGLPTIPSGPSMGFPQPPTRPDDFFNWLDEEGRKKDAEFKKRKEQAEATAEQIKKQAQKEAERARDAADEQTRRWAEETKKILEDAAREVGNAAQDIYRTQQQAAEDYYRNLAKACNDVVDVGRAVVHFVEREISGTRDNLTAAAKRARRGKIVEAVWELHIDELRKTNKSAAQLANDNQYARQAMQVAATYYGGPAGAAAYAAWLTYNATGNAEDALRVGMVVAIQSYAAAGANMPSGTAGELVKKAIVTGAAGGLAVAAAGGDDKAVQEAFLKQGGMVLMQGGQSYITKKFDSTVDSFCTSGVGTSCKPALDYVARDSNGNIILDNRGRPSVDTTKVLATRQNLGNWTDASKIPAASSRLPGVPSVTFLNGDFAISWNKDAFNSKSVNIPAVAISYVGAASPYAQKVEELQASLGAPPKRAPVDAVAVEDRPELWVALGDVGKGENFFRRLFVRSGDTLAVGDIVRAERNINARPRPAAFGEKTHVLPSGSIIVIGEIRELPTRAGPSQRWARLDLDVN